MNKKTIPIAICTIILAIVLIQPEQQRRYFVAPVIRLGQQLFHFTFLPTSQGRITPDHSILIDQSCAGIRFRSITVITVLILWITNPYHNHNHKQHNKTLHGVARATILLISSFLITIITNTIRIVASIIILQSTNTLLHTDLAHELLAIAFFVPMLILHTYCWYRLDSDHHVQKTHTPPTNTPIAHPQ